MRELAPLQRDLGARAADEPMRGCQAAFGDQPQPRLATCSGSPANEHAPANAEPAVLAHDGPPHIEQRDKRDESEVQQGSSCERTQLSPLRAVHALERDKVKLAVHEQGTVELVGNGLHIGLGQDEFTDALPMVAAFSLRRQRQQVITHVLHCAQNLAVLRRQRVGQLLLQVGGAEECHRVRLCLRQLVLNTP